MSILVPDDPVFFSKFQSLEALFLHQLYFLNGADAESDEERVIFEAYDGWVRLLLKLPHWFNWQGDDVPAGSAAGGYHEYSLYGPRGDQLTSLYPVEVAAADLGLLSACLHLFIAAKDDAHTDFGRALSGLPEGADRLVDVFRRVMELLSLPVPGQLLGALRHVVPRGPVERVTLTDEQEAEYRRFCGEIVSTLSSGDTFAYLSHRAMYL